MSGSAATTLDELVEAARAGSAVAFEAIWRTLSPVVAGYLRGRGAQDVEDLTSEVFLGAFQRLPTFEGDGAAFRRWLFTIAHHRSADDLRRRVRRAVEEPYEPESDPRRVPSAADDALAHLAQAEVLTLLADLPEDQRNVLLLRIVADLAVADVAAVMHRSPDAVRQLHHRAVARLRRGLLGPHEPVTESTPETMAQS
ncbi:sigma-70 family RNA polymerase sigma factor [Sporichthya sp.]|uniref:RNA polymerase sigma factor n=1 Tax=Sporichthya sp. TaxID=65475 RepID=UPI0017B81B37|nr:sigma-70 family RNA polymerase sigma factor [Sporichthya sp.]MBA3743549.1 sigma-70 family RNA polymerase sigma factor [Sporichthya sp.]